MLKKGGKIVMRSITVKLYNEQFKTLYYFSLKKRKGYSEIVREALELYFTMNDIKPFKTKRVIIW